MAEAGDGLRNEGEALFKKGMGLMRQLEQAAAIRCIERAADVRLNDSSAEIIAVHLNDQLTITFDITYSLLS